MTKLFGIDASEYQGVIDFMRAKATGKVQFAILRSGDGNYDDDKFDINVAGAIAAGVPVSAYHFIRANTIDAAKAEAQHFIDRVKPYQQIKMLAADIESSQLAAMDKDTTTAVCNAFMDALAATGYTVTKYYNPNWRKNELNHDALPQPWWLAYYSGEDSETADHSWESAIWQYASDGHIDGISGNVDLNVAYVDFWGITDPAPVQAPPALAPAPPASNGLVIVARGTVQGIDPGDGLNLWKSRLKQKGNGTGIQFHNGDAIDIIDWSVGGWYQILYNGVTGWVDSQYVQAVGITPVSAPVASPIEEGSKVKIVGTQYANGVGVPQWVRNNTHTVSQISGDRALLGNPNGINSWVKLADLEVV